MPDIPQRAARRCKGRLEVLQNLPSLNGNIAGHDVAV